MEYQLEDLIDVPLAVERLIRDHAIQAHCDDLADNLVAVMCRELAGRPPSHFLYCRSVKADDGLRLIIEPHDRLTVRLTRAIRVLRA